MLLSIQFPLVDLRRFLNKRTGCIGRPGWPEPYFDPEYPDEAPFVRGFGQVKKRDLGGLEFWGEDVVCDARRVIRWKGPFAMPRYGPYSPLPTEVAFRSFYFDGATVGKCEVGIATTGKPELHLSTQRLADIHTWFLQHDVSVPALDGKRRVVVPLESASPHLQAALRRASTRSTWKGDGSNETGWFSGGSPMLFCQMGGAHEDLRMDANDGAVRMHSPAAGVYLACFRIRRGNRNIPLWVMVLEDAADRTRARQLRLCLLRMHAEHEALRVVLHNLGTGRISVQRGTAPTEALQAYLRDRHRRLFRNRSILRALSLTTREDQDTSVDELAIGLMEEVWPGQLAALQGLLQQLNLRRSIGLNLDEDLNVSVAVKELYVARNIIKDVSGSNIMQDVRGDNNRQTFAPNAGMDDATRKRLDELQQQLKDALAKAPPDQADDETKEAVAEAAAEAIAKASKEKPNRKSVELSVQGLKHAAEGIAGVVPIALSIANTIATFLTGG